MPEMEKHAEMLRLLPLKDSKEFAMITMLCSDLSSNLNASLERDQFIEPHEAVIARIDILAKYLNRVCSTQEVDVSELKNVMKDLKVLRS